MPREKLRLSVLFLFRLSIAIVLLGALLKIMHWPYAAMALTVGTFGVIFFYTLRFILKSDKKLIDVVKFIFILSWACRPILEFPKHPELTLWVQRILGLLLINSSVYILLLKPSTFIPNPKKNKFSQALFATCGMTILLGSLFKIMHWPLAGVLLSIGFVKSKLKDDHRNFDTLDSYLIPDQQGLTTQKKSAQLSLLEKAIIWLSAIFMVSGIMAFYAELPFAGLMLLIGFLCGGIFVFLSFRN